MTETTPNSTRNPKTYAIIGAAMEVHRVFGCGFSEPVYQEVMAREMTLRQIPHEKEKPIVIYYKGQALECTYRGDFLCFGEIIVELKALDRITGVERSQVINYLKATGLKVALLINFGADSLEYERIVLDAE